MRRATWVSMLGMLCVLLIVVISGCSGSGKGGERGGGSGTTVVSGKVTLSSSIIGLGKPSLGKSIAVQSVIPSSALSGNEQTTLTGDTSFLQKLNASLFQSVLANASVDMYDADHPEWLYPVSTGSTDSDGNYTLTTMTNSSKNAGSGYADGDPIPAGSYTLIAYSGFGLGQKPIVAVQSIVKSFDGTIPNIDFEVLPSDVNPEVIYMFGTRKITDGTERWGFDGTGVNATLPANSAIQLSFSLPMWRDSMKTGIVFDPPIAGKWSLSADWLTATYYLDPGVQMVPGQDYTITISGEDADPSVPRALNVYGNALKLTATGKFTATAADAIGPTVQWNSPTVIEMGGAVDVTQSFRIESNKPLDVNGIVLRGSPSIGVKPGVLFLGRTSAGLYVYEFLLGEPLKLNTRYSLSVFGGRDLAGHAINTLTGSITTKDAANTPGIDPNAAPAVQDLQAQVKSVFGKWVRAMNDRNIATWQSVMSGEFYMEYDVATKPIDSTWDVNRDGRYSLGEYSRQLVTNRFPLWEFCGSTITGVVTPTAGQYINVNPLTQTADFDFKLSFANETNLTTCVASAPKETFYMTLSYKNGGWKIVRGSIGIDTRSRDLTKPNFISGMKLTESVTPFLPFVNDRDIGDGGLLYTAPDNTNLRVDYSWNAGQGVTVYVLILADERAPSRGFALAFPATVLSLSSMDDPIVDLKGIDLGSKLGFSSYANFKYLVGGKYRWEVLGLGTATATPDPTNPNDPNFIGNKTAKDIIADISAVSSIKRFGIAGIYGDLTFEVRAGSSSSGTPMVYSPAIGGYDLGSAFQATITVYTPFVTTPTASMTLSAAARKTYDLTFVDRKATITVPLYYGRNSFSVFEQGVPAGTTALSKGFQVLTLGGKQPPISFWEVSDDLGNILSGDEWFYYKAPGASKIRVQGALADLAFNTIRWSLSNSSGATSIFSSGTFSTSGVGDNIFSTATKSPPDLEIYQGNNFITFSQSIGSGSTFTSYRNTLVVYTDTGSVWVPPIVIQSITAAGASVFTKTNDYGTSSDWTANLAAAANYTATITGKLKNPGSSPYYVSSEGGYTNGTIVTDGSGNFSVDVLLWAGLSSISLRDSQNNYYYIYLNAGTTGKPFNKPTITRIDGIAYDPAASQNQYADTNCTATIQGTADAGQMYVYWNGTLSGTGYSEYQNVQNSDGTFSFSVPLVGPGGTNNVNIYDFNNRRASITITTTGACAYSPPTFALTSVSTAAGPITPSGSEYNAGGSGSVTVAGTSNRESAKVNLRIESCYQQNAYSAVTAANGSWSIPNVMVYGLGSTNWNYANIDMANQYQNFTVVSSNSQSPTLRLNVTSVAGNAGPASSQGSPNCGSTQWNAGGTSTSMTINGTTTMQNGVMHFTDTVNRQGQVQIANGSFTIPNVPIFNGTNTMWIQNWDDPQGSSQHYLQVNSTNGVPKPRFVTITSPAQGAINVTGTNVTVSGTIADPMGTGFSGNGASIYASVWSCGSSKYFSNDSYAQQNYGYLPASVAADSFSIPNVNFSTGCAGADPANIYVSVYDYTSGASHYHQIFMNEGASPSPDYWGKAGFVKQAAPEGPSFFLQDNLQRSFRLFPK